LLTLKKKKKKKKIYENFINRYIYIFLLGGISALDELQFYTGERRHLSEQLLKKVYRGLLFRKLWDFLNIFLTQYQSSVAILSYFLRGLVNPLLSPRVSTSYRYGKGIVQLVVLFILINTHLQASKFLTENL